MLIFLFGTLRTLSLSVTKVFDKKMDTRYFEVFFAFYHFTVTIHFSAVVFLR